MKCEVESPVGYPSLWCLLISYPGNLNHIPRDRNVSPSRRSVVAPLCIAIDQIVNPSHRGVERETPELGPEREKPDVTLADVYEDVRSWIDGQEMMKGAEKTHGGHCRELLQLVYNHHLAIPDIHATDEKIETICNEGRVKVGEYWHCHEVFQR